jgi:zinc protease
MKSAILLVSICAAGALLFAAPKETPPPGAAPKPFHLPQTDDFTLPNGMQVTIAPYGVVPKVEVRAYVEAGGVYEPENEVWISKLSAQLMKEGTATRSAEEVANEAGGMGGQLEIGADSEFTTAGGEVLSEFGPRFIALLADVLQHPALPAPELARLKADLARDLAIEKSQSDSLAREHFLQTLFPNHPYGRSFPPDGALNGYTIEQVHAFYDGNFAASRTHLYVSGKIDPGLKQAITNAFSSWKRGEPAAASPATPVKTRSFQLIDRPGAAQSTLYIGLPVADPQSPDYITLDVMDALLGGSFASRITSNIREQKGYTYSPRSQIGTRKHLAFWVETADVTTAVTGPSIREILYEIDRIRKEPPSEAELTGIQNYLAGLFVLRNTISPGAVIGQLHFVDSQGLDRAYLSTYVQKVMAVTPQDIQRVSESYIVPSKITFVVVGDKAKISEQLKPYEN